jgi:predicted Rossmann fold nucleotide-binding protein DprA/Smf involved in DNA uptake
MTLAPAPPMGPTTLSDNTQAVLLLTSPLLASGAEAPAKAKVLTAGEYGQLAQNLLQARHQPADLLNGSREAVLASASADLDPDRLNLLLSRGFQLGQALEHWANRSITVIGRADEVYPKRYKQRLKHQAPPLLYACGNLALLHRPTLAVVGSRATHEGLLQDTTQIGTLAAVSEVVIASGAAKGVDEAAMLGALQAGGSAIGVVADSLEKIAAKPIWRQALMDGRLLLLSADAPSARFQVWRAMARNKLIYALADAALVMSSAKDSGGTWEGAEEQLTKLRCCGIHVVDDPRGGEGLPALHAMGASLWPYPKSPDQLKAVLVAQPIISTSSVDLLGQHPLAEQDVVQESLLAPSVITAPEAGREEHREQKTDAAAEASAASPTTNDSEADLQTTHQPTTAAERLSLLAHQLVLEALVAAKTEDDLQELLKVTKPQIKQWCKELIGQGLIRKMNKPIRYVKC